MDSKKKVLFVGGGSEIALKILNKLKKNNIYNLSRKKNKLYKENYIIDNYSNSNLDKKFKSINQNFDIIVIFNGSFEFSTLSFLNEKKFLSILNINLLIPIRIVNKLITNNLLNTNSKVFFLSSKAANLPEVGNAYYSISKNSLNFAAKILNKEHKKKKIKFITISAGIIESKMGKKVKQLISLNNKRSLKNLDTSIYNLVNYIKSSIENKRTIKL